MRADTLTTPVTVVSALPGYGKTTSLAPLRSQDGTTWVDIPPDGDPGEAVDTALADSACGVLVVDDAHLLDPNCQAAASLARVLDHPPRTKKIVVSGRPPLPLPVSGSVAHGYATEIAEAELALQPAQVAELLESELGRRAAPVAGTLYDLSAGWPAIVTLAISEFAQQRPADWERLADPSCAPGGMCQDFVAEQVLACLTTAELSVLQLAAHLDRPTEAVIVAGGLDQSGTVINHLVRRHLLRRSAGDHGTALRMVPVLAATVRAIMPMSAGELAEVLTVAGKALVADGRPDDGLTVFTQAGDISGLTAVLSEYGQQLLRDGRTDAVIGAARAIPVEVRPPSVVMHLGEALQVRGDYEGALHCYEQLAGDDELPPELAWRIGVIYYLNGEPRRADEYYRRGRLDAEDTADEAHLLGWMASAAWMTGDLELCANLAHRSLEAARRCGDAGALATAHVALGLHSSLSGSRRELAEHYERAIDYADQAGDLLQSVRARSNLAAHRVTEGALERALDELGVAGRMASEAGFAAFEALSYINSGEALVHLARLDEAMAAFEQAKAIYQRMGSRKVAYALNGIGDVHRHRGALALARAAYSESLTTIEKGEDLQAYVPAQCGLARVLGPTAPGRAGELARHAIHPTGPGQAAGRLGLG